jgi:hypothetical protein
MFVRSPVFASCRRDGQYRFPFITGGHISDLTLDWFRLLSVAQPVLEHLDKPASCCMPSGFCKPVRFRASETVHPINVMLYMSNEVYRTCEKITILIRRPQPSFLIHCWGKL